MKYLLTGLSTDRLIFEKVNALHYNQWLKFFEDPRTSLHWVEERDNAGDACEKWYEKQLWRYENNKGGMNALLEKASGKLVGHAGLLVQTVDGIQELEIGYSLLPEFWNKGYAIEAATFCKQYAFAECFSDSLISIISLSNLPSQKVATKNGMVIEKQTNYNGNEVFIYRVRKTSSGL
jgi:ribosomal-protein-alanine N-acetyltransferase